MRFPDSAMAIVAVLGLFPICCGAGEEAAVDWVVGPALRQRLASPVGVVWSGVPLRRAVGGLARQNRVALVLDRRIDPDRKLDRAAHDVPLADVLNAVTAEHEAATVLTGSFVYLGPEWTAARLRGVFQARREAIRRLPAAAAEQLMHTARFAWDDFAQPAALLRELCQEHSLKLVGIEQVPHDLWAATSLPSLPLIDRLGLIAIQYDLTFAFSQDGNTLTLVPIPEDVPEAADATVKEPPAGRKTRPKVVAGEQRYTVRQTKGPVSTLLNELATKLGYKVKWNYAAIEAAGISLEENVTFQVKDATLDELFEAVLRPAGLTCRRTGKTLEVLPAGQASEPK